MISGAELSEDDLAVVNSVFSSLSRYVRCAGISGRSGVQSVFKRIIPKLILFCHVRIQVRETGCSYSSLREVISGLNLLLYRVLQLV